MRPHTPHPSTVNDPAWEQVSLDGIREPGAYVCVWDGHLMRVTADDLAKHRAVPETVAAEPLYVRRVSENPFVSVTRARILAANHDVAINF